LSNEIPILWREQLFCCAVWCKQIFCICKGAVLHCGKGWQEQPIQQSWRKKIRRISKYLGKHRVCCGLHNLLRDEGDLVAAAQTHGGTLHDVRVPTVGYPIANGVKRSGKRCLAVGTDCSVGKMYTAMAMDAEMQKRSMKSTFRATGQTGILIEGQGSLFHVSYSGVTMALIHGGQPDAIVLAHEPTRTHMRGLPDYNLPSLEALRDTALPLAKIANPACQVVGISINTQHMSDDEATAYCKEVEDRMGLPTIDPYRHGAGRLVDALAAV